MRIRDIIRGLPVSRIAEVTAWGMGDPQVIPRSLGRRHVHIGFNRVGRDRALQDGHTFYMYKAGLPEGRSTTAEYLTGLQCPPVAPEQRVLVTSSGMIALTLSAQVLINQVTTSSSSRRCGQTSGRSRCSTNTRPLA